MPDLSTPNGGNISGHSKKWEDPKMPNRRFVTGRKASRTMGTGQQGLDNQKPSDAVDTTKMSPDEKLKYFQSLGLVPTGTPAAPKDFQVTNNFAQDIKTFFSTNPKYLKDIIDLLDSVPDEKQKSAKIKAYRVLKDLKDQSPELVYKQIRDTIQDQF